MSQEEPVAMCNSMRGHKGSHMSLSQRLGFKSAIQKEDFWTGLLCLSPTQGSSTARAWGSGRQRNRARAILPILVQPK